MYLQKNLSFLEQKNKVLADKIQISALPDFLNHEKSRRGPLTVKIKVNEEWLYLYSRFDPLREAERQLQNYAKGGFYAVCGFPPPYLLEKILQNRPTGILILEPSLSWYKFFFSHFDYSLLIQKAELFFYNQDPEHISAFLHQHYTPLLEGNFNLFLQPVRGKTDKQILIWKEKIDSFLYQIKGEYSTQAFFGKKWFRNCLLNLFHVPKQKVVIPALNEAVIIGAGPSLNQNIKKLKSLQGKIPLIAVDTALPLLNQGGVIPDIVISMDAQSYSYLHFLKKPLQASLFLYDLCSSPFISRQGKQRLFCHNRHPLAAYLAEKVPFMQALNPCAGNVSAYALALAKEKEASCLYLCGMDFQFKNLIPYARESYIDDYFRLKANRFTPHLGGLLGFSLSQNIIKDGRIYSTEKMISYKAEMEGFLLQNKIDFDYQLPKGLQKTKSFSVAESKIKPDWNNTLIITEIQNKLQEFKKIRLFSRRIYKQTSPKEAMLFSALLSTAHTEIKKQPGLSPQTAIQQTINWASALCQTILDKK